MSATYLALNVHVIFATKGRAPTIAAEWRSDFHAYMGGAIRGLGGVPLAVGGVADHVHFLARIKATHAVADLIREVKKASSQWAASRWDGFAWQTGYAALSVSPADVPVVIDYVGRQEEHHRTVSSADELRAPLGEAGVEIDERFFE